MNFEYYFRKHWKPDVLVVNEDSGSKREKEALCNELGIQFKILKRIPHGNLPPISTTSIIEKIKLL
jgi:hypothetical protein